MAALEIMASSLRIRELIRNGESEDKTFYKAIGDSKPIGWQTFDQHIIELYQNELISAEVAKSYCSDFSVVSMEIDRVRARCAKRQAAIADFDVSVRCFRHDRSVLRLSMSQPCSRSLMGDASMCSISVSRISFRRSFNSGAAIRLVSSNGSASRS